MSDKIEEIRITLALNPKQIAERMLSGEVTSESHFVSQEDHLHVASLVDTAHREIAKLRAEIERLRKVYVLIATESAGIVEGGSIFEDKIAGCYASHQSADKAGENLGYVNWRIEEHKIISNALEGKP